VAVLVVFLLRLGQQSYKTQGRGLIDNAAYLCGQASDSSGQDVVVSIPPAALGSIQSVCHDLNYLLVVELWLIGQT